MQALHTVYLSLGSNQRGRRRYLLRTIAKIEELIGTVERQSAFRVTEPWGYKSRHKYLNACVRVLTEHSPREVLNLTQQIERELGRRQKTTVDAATGALVYHDRPIDIDILLYDDLVVDEPDLQIPHPRMAERAFVMISLREVMGSESLELRV